MKIDKIKDTFNDYKVEMSWGQLEVIAAALERDHADPVADELFAELTWYMDKLPGPGESEEDIKAREEATAGMEEEPLAMPPSEGEIKPPDQEGETPFEKFTGREEPPSEMPPEPAPGGDIGLESPPVDEINPEDLDVAPMEEPPPPKGFNMMPSGGGMSTPAPTMDSQKEKPKKAIQEKKAVVKPKAKITEGLEEHADAVLRQAGLRPGKDYRWDRGLVPDPEMADAIVTVLGESGEFSKVTYHPDGGRVMFGTKSMSAGPRQPLEELPAPPVE